MSTETYKPEISQQSGGPTPDELGLKLTGKSLLRTDLKRTQEVELVLRGVVRGHEFVDEYDGDGNVRLTIKYAKVKVDELVSIDVIPTRDRSQIEGQTAMNGNGQVVDVRTQQPVSDEDLEAAKQVLAEAGIEVVDDEAPEGVDPETGEITEEPGAGETVSDPQPEEKPPPPSDAFDRHPQVPEDAWRELNVEQKEDVLGKINLMERLAEVEQAGSNPTDREAARTQLEQNREVLKSEYGIELLDPSEIPEPAPADEPPPPPVTATSGPLSRRDLEKRATYLRGQGALPAEMAEARNLELQEIDRRLAAQAG